MNQRYVMAVITEVACQDAKLIMVKEGAPLACDLPTDCEVSPVSSHSGISQSINVYPQPATGELILQTVLPTPPFGTASFHLLNLSGKKVFSRHVPAAASLSEKI